MAKLRKRTPARIAAEKRVRKRRMEDPVRRKAVQDYNRAWSRANRDKIRNNQLKTKYGITLDEFRAMLNRQKGRCACCRRTDPGRKDWHVDHDHATGLVRGAICWLCNLLIGMLGDRLGPARRRFAQVERYLRKAEHGEPR